MATFRHTLFFQVDVTGWSETLYIDAPDLTQALTIAASLTSRRCTLCGSPDDVQIVSQRVQDVNNPAVLDLKFYNALPGKPAVITAVDQPWTGVLVRLTTTTGRRRLMLLRGVPDAITVPPMHLPPTDPQWRDAFDLWASRLKQTDVRVQVLKKTANPLQTISLIAANAAGQLEVTATAHGLSTGDHISFYRVSCADLTVTGKHPITKIDADKFLITSYNVGQVQFNHGQFRKVLFEYEAIANVTVERKGARKVGRPFGLLRGRRFARKR